MSASPPPYRYERLPGRRLGLFQRASLWLGADHLLVVHETMTGESYRRFFLRDIRAFVVQRTSRREHTTLVLSALTLANLLPLVALTSGVPTQRTWAWLACGSAVWIALLLVNLARGPACVVRIRTAVQEDVVAPLARLHTARRVIESLRPRIMGAQSPGPATVPSPDGQEGSRT